MLVLYEELAGLIRAFNATSVEYALCGGLAMAVHGKVRATVDVDLLIDPDSVDAAKEICRSCGYTIEARPMLLAGGAVAITRLTRLDPASGDAVSVDLLHVSEATRPAWESREYVQWGSERLCVVSRDGLIALKRLRQSGQDMDDIAWLEAQR